MIFYPYPQTYYNLSKKNEKFQLTLKTIDELYQGKSYDETVNYQYHCINVCSRVIKYHEIFSLEHDIDIYCAALLHDIVEDNKLSFIQLESLFGKLVTSYVITLTRQNEGQSYLQYIESVIDSGSIASMIKWADLSENLLHCLVKPHKFGYLVERYSKALLMIENKYHFSHYLATRS